MLRCAAQCYTWCEPVSDSNLLFSKCCMQSVFLYGWQTVMATCSGLRVTGRSVPPGMARTTGSDRARAPCTLVSHAMHGVRTSAQPFFSDHLSFSTLIYSSLSFWPLKPKPISFVPCPNTYILYHNALSLLPWHGIGMAHYTTGMKGVHRVPVGSGRHVCAAESGAPGLFFCPFFCPCYLFCCPFCSFCC
jgi:hypothetical protein